MKRAGLNITDLVKNEYFVKWIMSPTQESTHYWSKWIVAHPERKKDVEMARQLISSMDYQIDETMPEIHYDVVLENIVTYSQKKESHKDRINFPWRRLAVAGTIILGVAFTVLSIRPARIVQNEAVVERETIIKEVLPGQKLTMRLPDGSKVILNSESKLTYSLPFVSNRKVDLIGEAFFEVARDEQNPFIVQSGYVTTKVLGTSFNIKSYPGNGKNSIAVLTGKVEVSDNQGNKAYLTPNERGVFNLKEKQLLIGPFSMETEIGWKDGLMAFDNTPIPDVFAQLERWYGIEVTIKDKSILTGYYTGSYKKPTLPQVMDGIGYALGLDFSITKKEVIINKRKTQ